MLAELKRHIKEKAPAPLYVFHGEETYLRDHYLSQLKSLIVPEGTEAFNYSRFDGAAPDIPRVIDAVPFMADRRMAVLWDVDIYGFDGDTKEEFSKYLSSGWEGVTIVAVYDATPYKPDKRTKLYKEIAEACVTVEFAEQTSADLLPWVKRRFGALGKQIDADSAEHLLFTCGHLMGPLTLEIEKIAAYCGADAIKRRHIDAVGSPTVEAAVFDLTDAICAGQFGKALELLNRLFDLREEPVMLMGALGKQLRGLYLARLALERGQGSQVVVKGMGYRSAYPANKLMQSARRVKLPWCRRAVMLCAETDSDMKQGRDRQAVLERLIMELSAC